MPDLVWLIPGLPALGFLALAFWGRRLARRAVGLVACVATGLAFLLALWATAYLLGLPADERSASVALAPWIWAGDLQVRWSFLLDPLSAEMILVVTGVGFLIHIYSVGYMGEDRDYPRFFAYLNLFMACMLVLVLADNFLVMFLGWEGVGLCSYLLIGFWYEKQSAADAGKKAFVVNRVGDAGFLLALFLIFGTFGTLDFNAVFARAGAELAAGGAAATLIALGLFVGATGKSAQVPLYVWLPDAMEGPTPVSALIHAATMVTAGVYMVVRTSALFDLAPDVLWLVAGVGAFTAVFAATIACVQTDIKRVVAYSTISQLGYMFLGCGVGAYASAMFHLATHAFFKALLFLGCGSVIHALSGEQDVRKMGGLWRALPWTGWTFLIGCLANLGLFPLAGFWSKDEILVAAFAGERTLVGLLGMVGAVLTAFYMARLFLLMFFGPSRVDPHAAHHLHESPRVMVVPLLLLAGGSALVGLLGFPPHAGIHHHFLEPVLGGEAHGPSHAAEVAAGVISTVLALLGMGGAWYLYARHPEAAARVAGRHPTAYRWLRHKYYVDELYDGMIVEPIRRGAIRLWQVFDDGVIDNLVNRVGAWVEVWALGLRQVQSGAVPTYVLSFLAGVVAILAYFLLAR
jgi:NADH-quinone oxidoreductase subunit L